jgi:3-oxoacyl-[acyl-carrier-protein] synthase II
MGEVWITGAGAVSAAGMGREPLVRLLSEGASAVGRQPASGEWVGAAPAVGQGRELRRLDRAGRLFAAAGQEAWNASGLAVGSFEGSRAGLFEGSSLGPLAEVAREAREGCPGGDTRRAARLSRFMIGSGGASFAQSHGIHGPVLHLAAGSVSSACAIGEAFLQVAWGRLDLALAGGGEAPLTEDVLGTFRSAGILGSRDDWPCRPFDAKRQGTVLGEGAGALVLESAEHAARRGARPLGIMAGYAIATASCAFAAPEPDGAGVADSSAAALAMAGTRQIAWIKAHGTGTRVNDLAECRGLARLLGGRLPESPITSIKSSLGHTLGASAGLETVAALLALELGIVPGTVGTDTPDPLLPSCTIATQPQRARNGDVLVLAESFGGRSVALVIRPI